MPRKKKDPSDEPWPDKAFLKQILKLEDIQRPDGTVCSAGGWILDKPLPKRPTIEFLKAAHEACMESLSFYSLDIPWHPSLIGRENEHTKDERLKDTKDHIEKCVARLWEICLLVADVTEKDAVKEYNDYMAGKRPDLYRQLQEAQEAMTELLPAQKKTSSRSRKERKPSALENT